MKFRAVNLGGIIFAMAITFITSNALAQGLGAIAEKTVILFYNNAGTQYQVTTYIAASGKIYQTSNAYRSVMGTAPSMLTGGEFQIGRTIEHDHYLESAKCRSKNTANFNGRVLALRSTSTCSAPLVKPFTSSGGYDIELLGGDRCNVKQTPPGPIIGCKIVAGRNLRQ